MVGGSQECNDARQALSAQLDNEASVNDLLVVARHIPNCDGCWQYSTNASELRRRSLRLWPEPTVPSPLALAMTEQSVPAEANPASRRPKLLVRTTEVVGSLSGATLALAIVGCTQLILAIVAAVTADTHDVRHLAAWSAVFGIALIVTAAAPSHAPALVPVAIAVPVMMLATSASDWRTVVVGLTEPAHILEFLGAGLLLWVAVHTDRRRLTSSATSAPM